MKGAVKQRMPRIMERDVTGFSIDIKDNDKDFNSIFVFLDWLMVNTGQ